MPAIKAVISTRVDISEYLEIPMMSLRIPVRHDGISLADDPTIQESNAYIDPTTSIGIVSRTKFNRCLRATIGSTTTLHTFCRLSLDCSDEYDLIAATVADRNKTILNTTNKPNANNPMAAFLRNLDILVISCTKNRIA
jgi:hypothetical protein